MTIPKVVVLIETSRGFGRNLLRGIANYVSIHSPWVFYQEIPSYIKFFENKINLEQIKKWKPDGIIMREIRNMDEIIELGVPTIVSTYSKEIIPEVSHILVDSVGAGNLAAEHFLDRGFQNFAYCGFSDFFWSEQRRKGFSDRVTKAGYQTFDYKPPKSKWKLSWDKEQPILSNWLQNLPKPVGLMTCIDERSKYVVEACKIVNIHIPEEIAIVGCDDDDLICELSNPQLSSVALNAVNAGYEAAELLDNLMAGRKPSHDVIFVQASHVVVRHSSDITAIQDPDVAKAINFIRTNAHRTLQVSDVVNATVLSRRVLQMRFHDTLKRSIFEEIKRVRVNKIAQMLIETDLSISQIALKLGFSSETNLSRYFQQEKGMNMRVFRKQYGYPAKATAAPDSKQRWYTG